MDAMGLAQVCQIDPIVADILLQRGITTVQQAQNFLFGKQMIYHDPMTMQDMPRAVARIWQAIKRQENILIVGDSDADGITATAVLLMYLRSVGAKVTYYIPTSEEIMSFWQGKKRDVIEGISLILTVDTGISSSLENTAFAGIDVIITDHHECKRRLPMVYAVIDPKRRDDTYPFAQLSGAGVALKLICALAAQSGNPQDEFLRYCDLVAIGTVADAMPLHDENRCIVKQGLARIQKRQRVGLDMLLKSAAYNFHRPITASSAGFVIAPRLNAAGRIGRSDLAIDLLCTEDYAQARALSEKLAQLNRDRQQLEGVSVEKATALMEQEFNPDNDRLIFLRVEDWPTGMPGIVASRLVDRYALPCIIVSFSDGVGRGSGRSIKGFDMFRAIEDHAELLTEFGGHELAAGFTVTEEHFDSFRRAMQQQAQAVFLQNGYQQKLPISATLSFSQITIGLARQLQLLEPFGMENIQPLFLTKEVMLEELMPLANARHMRLTLSKDGKTFTGLMFGRTLRELACTVGDTVDIIYALDIHVGKDDENLQLIIKSMEVSQCCQVDSYECEYKRFMAGEIHHLPDAAIPDRKDIIDVYSYLLRTMGEADAAIPRYQTVMARRISRAFGKPFNYSQLMLSLHVLSELKMVELTDTGHQIQIRVNCCKEKKNLTQSALWKRLKR